MKPRARILTLRLLEKQKRSPEYAGRMGIQVNMVNKGPKKREDRNV